MNIALAEALNLSVMFGLRSVLAEVNLRLERGHLALITGANGAGKSTLVHALCGLIGPSAGQVRMFGQDVRRLQAQDRRRVGVMLHRSMLYRNLTPRENLEFYAKLNGCERASEDAARWLERMGLSAVGDQRARELSRGMEQRLAIARALIGEPELILFDEPFASLDPQGTALVVDLLQERLARGAAVLVTSHETVALKDAEMESYRLNSGRLLPAGAEANRRIVWRWMLS
jgi:ABC-2 type transport system ATP-binding protein